MDEKHPWSYKFAQTWLIINLVKLIFGPVALVASLFPPDLPEGVTKESTSIPSRQQDRRIKVDVYRNQTTLAPVPVHLHFHGSGYIFPGHGTDGAFCSYLCKTLGIIVLDCDYRKFPSPFPNAYNDCLDLVEWCCSQTDSGWDANKLTISGKSAGGGLALAVASTKNLKDKIKAVTCLYPPTDFRKSGQSHTSRQSFRSQKYDSGMPLTRGMVKLCDDAYVLDSTDRSDPRLSTILARAEDFPRHVWVGTGSCDILFNKSKHFILHLQNQGRPDADFVFMEIKNEGHAFDGFCKKGSVSEKRKNEAYEAICRTIRAGWSD